MLPLTTWQANTGFTPISYQLLMKVKILKLITEYLYASKNVLEELLRSSWINLSQSITA